MNKKEKQKQGKKNKQAGARFEIKVRKDLEAKGWYVLKNLNTVVTIEEKDTIHQEQVVTNFFRPSKPKFNPYTKRIMMNSQGFPDFLIFRQDTKMFDVESGELKYTVRAVECKSNGRLSKEEKEKCKFLLDTCVVGKIYIASKGEKRGTIKYKEFE